MIFSTLVFNITLSETSFTLVPNIGDETPDFELLDIDTKIHTQIKSIRGKRNSTGIVSRLNLRSALKQRAASEMLLTRVLRS